MEQKWWDLFVALLLLLDVKGSLVKLHNGGYEDVVIGIHPKIAENAKIINSIKDMLKEASSYLFLASQQRFYFRTVKIVIPLTWASKPEYKRSSRESYVNADIIVAEPFVKYGDEPYTSQYGGCGKKGRYIHFTSNFLINDSLVNIYGSRGRILVHEWAHLRWGVFEEYSYDAPFYSSGINKIEATRYHTRISHINPKEKKYLNKDFRIENSNIRTAVLKISGTATTGNWPYSIKNTDSADQVISLTVTTRAASATVPPVTVKTYISNSNNSFPNPMIIYADVSQGFLPVIGAKVMATVESTSGKPVELALYDEGAGADIIKHDGIYSRYFIAFSDNGRYSIKVSVHEHDKTSRRIRRQNQAMYVSGYVDSGIVLNPPRPVINVTDASFGLGKF
nr:PREDICTED: epithelial chloride channel protein-like [Anolis carolinensis]|eukprot:XP_008107510.1 PREDICTED: epithelial chloride channel protein-like [Anolis carolinensis]